MAKARNLIVRAQDGSLTVVTGMGMVRTLDQGDEESGLAAELTSLIEKRQEAGKALTDALEDGGFEVEGRSHTDVWDPTDPPSPSPKRSKKSPKKPSPKKK